MRRVKRPRAPQRCWVKPVSEQNGAQASRRIVTEEARCLILSGVARRRVRKAEMPGVSAEAGREAGTIEGILNRSSIFSSRGDGSSERGDGGTILARAVNLTWGAQEWRIGQQLAVGLIGADRLVPQSDSRMPEVENVFGEGSSSADMKRGRAVGMHPGRSQGVAAQEAECGPKPGESAAREEGASRANWPKRA